MSVLLPTPIYSYESQDQTCIDYGTFLISEL